MPRVVCIAFLILAASPAAFGNTGASVTGVTQLVLGPVSYLVAAIGALFCLYQFARGNKQAAWFALGGFIFLALVRSMIPQWLGSSAMATNAATSLGEFPVYGQTIGVQTPGETNTYSDIKAWGYVGLYLCNQVTSLLFSIGLPILIGLAGGLYTYWRITVQHHPGSVIKFVIMLVLMSAFTLIPWFTFAPADATALQSNDVIVAINAMSASGAQAVNSNSASNTQIPALPALLLLGGVDVTEAIGLKINGSPVSANAAQLLTAARASQLPEEWLPQYEAFASQCAAAENGFQNAELQNPNSAAALLNQAAWKSGVTQQVNGASTNALSSWADNLFSWVPVYGYTMNNNTAYAVLHDRKISDQKEAAALLSKLKWVPSSLQPVELSGLPLRQYRLGSGDVTPEGFSQIQGLNIPSDEIAFTLPFGATGLGVTAPFQLNGAAILNYAVPYCSVPDPQDTQSAFGANLETLTYTQTSTPQISGIGHTRPTFTFNSNQVSENSAYLSDIISTISTNSQGGAVTIDAVDWGDQIRQSLIESYLTANQNTFCEQACPDAGNKYFWGCLVTGQFIGLAATDPNCQTASALTQAFYGTPGSGPASFADTIYNGLYNALPAKPRKQTDVDGLGTLVLANSTSWTTAPPEVRAAVDLIMAAPGTFSQNAMGVDPSDPPKDEGPASIWTVFSYIPKCGMWLLAMFATIAAKVITQIWPHFMGVTLMLILLVYPIFSMVALWPGKWTVLLDWARGMLWVLLWAPIVSLGYAFMNGGAVLTQNAGFNSMLPGPGQSVMTLIGVAMILMAPPIAAAILAPSYATLSQLGASVYGTGFKVIGMATTLAVSMLGVAGAAVGGTAGAVKGARSAAAAKEPASGQGQGDAQGGGSGHTGAATGGRLSQIVTGAAAGAKPALAVGRAANRMAMGAMGAVDALGLAGGSLSAGGQAGRRLGEVGEATAGAAAMTGWASARMAANGVATTAKTNGTGSGGMARRLAEDLSGGTGGAFTGAAMGLGDQIEAAPRGILSGSGDADAQGKFAAANMSAQRESYATAVTSGDATAQRSALAAYATYARSGAQAAMQLGSYQHATELMKQRADALGEVAASSGNASDFEAFQSASKQAVGFARQSEAHAVRRGDTSRAEAARRSVADLKGHEAVVTAGYAQDLERSADDLSRASSQPGTSEPERRTLAQMATDQRRDAVRLRSTAQAAGKEAMQGYAESVPALRDGLATASAAAHNDNPSAIWEMAGQASGLALVSRQATALTTSLAAAGIPVPTLPPVAAQELSWSSVTGALADARQTSGSVGGQVLEAIHRAGEGDHRGSARALESAAVAAAQAAGVFPGSSLGSYGRQLARTAEAMDEKGGVFTSIDQLNSLMRQVGKHQALSKEVDGLRSFHRQDAP